LVEKASLNIQQIIIGCSTLRETSAINSRTQAARRRWAAAERDGCARNGGAFVAAATLVGARASPLLEELYEVGVGPSSAAAAGVLEYRFDATEYSLAHACHPT